MLFNFFQVDSGSNNATKYTIGEGLRNGLVGMEDTERLTAM